MLPRESPWISCCKICILHLLLLRSVYVPVSKCHILTYPILSILFRNSFRLANSLYFPSSIQAVADPIILAAHDIILCSHFGRTVRKTAASPLIFAHSLAFPSCALSGRTSTLFHKLVGAALAETDDQDVSVCVAVLIDGDGTGCQRHILDSLHAGHDIVSLHIRCCCLQALCQYHH